MSGQEMPIITRTYDLLTWLVPVTNHFPRAHRYTVTRRLLDAVSDLREAMDTQPIFWDKFLLAYRRASTGKCSQSAVVASEYHERDHPLALQNASRTYTYCPGTHTPLFIHSIYGGQTMAYHTKDQRTSVIEVEGTEAQRLKNQAALQLLQAWRTDDAQEQADTWRVIKEALEEDRLSDRSLFQ